MSRFANYFLKSGGGGGDDEDGNEEEEKRQEEEEGEETMKKPELKFMTEEEERLENERDGKETSLFFHQTQRVALIDIILEMREKGLLFYQQDLTLVGRPDPANGEMLAAFGIKFSMTEVGSKGIFYANFTYIGRNAPEWKGKTLEFSSHTTDVV